MDDLFGKMSSSDEEDEEDPHADQTTAATETGFTQQFSIGEVFLPFVRSNNTLVLSVSFILFERMMNIVQRVYSAYHLLFLAMNIVLQPFASFPNTRHSMYLPLSIG